MRPRNRGRPVWRKAAACSAVTCISVNEEVVHGIGSLKRIAIAIGAGSMLAPGAGAPSTHPWMRAWAERLGAILDLMSEGVISKTQANDLVILVGVFIHWQAENHKKIYDFNYQATKESIARALQNKPSVDEVLQKYKAARHPFASGAEG